MKVLHIINNLGKGGAERILVDILPLYDKEKIKLSVLQLSDKYSEPVYIKMLQEQGISCSSLSHNSIYNPILILKLIKFISSGEYNVIHVHLFPALYWVGIASRICNKKSALVFTEHSTQNKRQNKPYLKYIEYFIYNSYDKILAISSKIQDNLILRIGSNDKVQLLQNGVNTSVFKQKEKYNDSFFLKEFSIPENTIKLMMTARFSYPKDHKTLINCFAQLPENYYLILVGEGNLKKEIEEHVLAQNMCNRVKFAGFRTDVPQLMKSVDLNILSSEYEGMSGVTLEALAAGVPFLGSNVLGINDIVPNDHFLFKTGSWTDLKLKIEQIFTQKDLRSRMIHDGVKKAEELDINITVQNHSILYRKIGIFK